MKTNRIACCYMVHGDHWYFEDSLNSFKGDYPTVVFLSRFPWGGKPCNTERTKEIAERCGAIVIEGIWITEDEMRRFVIAWCLENGFTHALLPDTDEIIETKLLQSLVQIAEFGLADRVYVEWDTYWRSPEYVIRPRERFTPVILIDVRVAEQRHLREYTGGRQLFLNESYGIINHLSYCGPDERIYSKITSWGHKDQVKEGWYERVWLGWSAQRMLRGLNPVEPGAYDHAERVAVKDELRAAFERSQSYSRDWREDIVPCASWPKISVVIPLCNGLEDIARCLEHLARINGLLLEVIVVDNGSDADVLAEVRKWAVRLVELGENKGFAFACNRGIEASSGAVVLLLNSDCFVTRAGIIRLINSLMSSATIAAAGPYTNRAGHDQQIEPTYSSLENLEGFAEDFATRATDGDIERDMLVGMCLAIRKSALDELGLLDENYGLGSWEDNDWCHRCRRTNWRLVLSTRSYVHHEGSKTLSRLGIDIAELFRVNQNYFVDKFRLDTELGFADTLAGLRAEPIKFDFSKKPELLIEKYRERGKRARISLCIIALNEARVIRKCIESALPFFYEIIVVDTGSTDRTVEILKEYPSVKVYQHPWEYSFSVARNQSIGYATGDWIFCMDCDDELPLTSAMGIIDFALAAPPDVGGLVMNVRFVHGTKTAGVRVDHLKLFRNRPDYRYTNRIHEQILGAVQRSGLRIDWSDLYVLHSGYDDSPAGQKRKRERDEYLLKLDLEDTPGDPFKLFNLGMSYHYWGEHETAIEWFKQCVAASQPHMSHIAPVYSLWASSLRHMGLVKEALAKAKEGVSKVPGYPELHFKVGLWCMETGAFLEARNNFRKCIGANIAGMYVSMDQGILGFKSMHELARAEAKLGHYEAAKEWWLKSLEAEPAYLNPVIELIEAAIPAKDFPVANAMLERIRASDGHSVTWAELMARQQDAITGPGGGLQFLLGFIERNPGEHGVRMALALALIPHSPNDAVQHFLKLDDVGIPQASFQLGKLSMAAGDFEAAAYWMERASRLDSGNDEARDTVAKLSKVSA